MFGLNAFFAALARLTAAVTRSAELFETANRHLEEQLGYEPVSTPSAAELEHQPAAQGNGRRRK